MHIVHGCILKRTMWLLADHNMPGALSMINYEATFSSVKFVSVKYVKLLSMEGALCKQQENLYYFNEYFVK